MPGNKRCKWLNERNPRYVQYHDEEWGVPCHEDARLFEALMLEIFAAGLSWETVLSKREAFRDAFDQWNLHKIASYGEKDVERLMQCEGIIRYRRKIEAVAHNANVALEIAHDFGSFDQYVWGFVNDKPIYDPDDVEATWKLTNGINEDLQKRGMLWCGIGVVNSFAYAVGLVNGHQPDCKCYSGPYLGALID